MTPVGHHHGPNSWAGGEKKVKKGANNFTHECNVLLIVFFCFGKKRMFIPAI